MLLQCLLWGKKGSDFVGQHWLTMQKGKVELVKEIIVNLARDVLAYEKEGGKWQWTPLPVEKFYESDGVMVRLFVLELPETLTVPPAKWCRIEKELYCFIQWNG